jgi:hypothetical protein
MRYLLIVLAVTSLMDIAGTASWAQQPGVDQAEYNRLKQQVIADMAKKKAARDHSMYMSQEYGRRAAWHFAEANAAGKAADDARARSAAIRTSMDLNAAYRRPYSIQVQPMGRGWYWITPSR